MEITSKTARILLIVGSILGIVQGFITLVGIVVTANDNNKDVKCFLYCSWMMVMPIILRDISTVSLNITVVLLAMKGSQ